MKVLIVDDEPIARQILREHLEAFSDVTIVGEAADGLSAVEQIQTLNPDLVFLDLQMPELGGLAVAKNLRGKRMPLIIFVTAFEQHALEAFDAGAVDYLLKPVRQERLAAAIQKVHPMLTVSAMPVEAKAQKLTAKRIVGRIGSDMHLLNPAEVIAFQADGETVVILTTSARYYAEHSLKALEERIDPETFRRVHRKTIINTDHIRKISPLSSKRWLLKMSNGLEVVVSKRLAGLIRDETRW